MQVGDSRYRWEFRLLTGESRPMISAPGRTAGLLIGPWLGSAPDSDLRVIRVAEYTFRAQVADRWRRANSFLLGDAAHLYPRPSSARACARACATR